MGRDDENLRSAWYAFLVLAFGGEPIWHVEDVGLDELDPKEKSPLELIEQMMGIQSTNLMCSREPLRAEWE